jgi:hypothetical protein
VKKKDESVKDEKQEIVMGEKKEFDSLPLSEGKSDITEATFVCRSHEVRELLNKETNESFGNKLFMKGVVMETGEEVEISQAIVIARDGNPREAGLWVKEIAGKLRIGTVVSMLRFLKLNNIGAVDGVTFKVVKNNAGYWIVNAY